MRKKAMSVEEFKKKAKEKFGGKYDYKLVTFKSMRETIIITCPEHGITYQTPHGHLKSKYGCFKCSVKTRVLSDEVWKERFIERARKIHGDKYDYSITVKPESKDGYIDYICPAHGVVRQSYKSHISKKIGCGQCARQGRRFSTEEFIRRAKALHGDKFTYTHTVYTGFKSPVTVTCKKHGDFDVTAYRHLSGRGGCRKCYGENGAQRYLRKETLISKAKLKLPNWQSPVLDGVDDPVRLREPIAIQCEKHGISYVTALQLIRGRGCKQCEKLLIRQQREHDAFVKKAIHIYGAYYDYGHILFKNLMHEVTLICPVHGSFKVKPYDHIFKGKECPECSKVIVRQVQFMED